MTTTQDFISELADLYPDDAEDLNDALAELQRQRLNTCERLARLSDSQWQRLGIPLGIESIIREELANVVAASASSPTATTSASSAPAPASAPPASRPSPVVIGNARASEHESPQRPERQAERRQRSPSPTVDYGGEIPLEPFEPSGGLRRRGVGGGAARELELSNSIERAHRQALPPPEPERKGLLGPMDLTPPPDLEILWQQLLEDCLPPDKRPSLQATWEAGGSEHDKYMMFLEYSSYLRKPEITEEEKAERRKQLEPMMRELGVRPGDDDDDETQSAILWWLLVGFIIFIAGLVYYAYTGADPAHDTQAL